MVTQRGRAVLIPKQLTAKVATPRLSEKGQHLLASAKRKIAALNEDMLSSVGLAREEADVAARAGLIDPDQKYWWLEDWQKGEREAERDIRGGRVSGPFATAEELFAHLDQQTR